MTRMAAVNGVRVLQILWCSMQLGRGKRKPCECQPSNLVIHITLLKDRLCFPNLSHTHTTPPKTTTTTKQPKHINHLKWYNNITHTHTPWQLAWLSWYMTWISICAYFQLFDVMPCFNTEGQIITSLQHTASCSVFVCVCVCSWHLCCV